MFQTFILILELILFLFVLSTMLNILTATVQTFEQTMSALQTKLEDANNFQFPYFAEDAPFSVSSSLDKFYGTFD